jgi:hypothetical protein
MANPDVSAQSFMTELMDLSLHLVWKDPFYAISEEQSGDRVDAEAYVAARNGELLFNSVFQFHTEVLQSFFPDPDELELVMRDKRMIPEDMRPAIVAAESNLIIEEWEGGRESNDYYRMLFGLPPREMPENEYVYNTRYADIDMTTPVHLLSYTDRLRLENLGYFAELRAQTRYSGNEYKYLEYLGKYRIYPYIARQAEPFELLYIQQSQYTSLRNDFIDTYEAARRMVYRVYYSDAYRNQSHLYEGFLGMCILFITQSRMFVKYLEADIPRNFYDLESLKLVYDAYSVPFYSAIPLKYHERIVKRINELIGYKGSNQVFYDLFDIFDFGRMSAYQYYLVKDRITNDDGNPIFRDADGNPLTPEQMWKIRFAKVGFEDDQFIAITDPQNAVEYEDITGDDPYWVEDENLKKKLYESDWNFFHSKYMGVQIMFELSKLLFETCYFLRMLQDNRESTENLSVYYMVTGEEYPLFDVVIYAVALLCKNAGFTGEIPSDPASVSAVYGFNFKDYAKLLKMGSENMDDFVKNFKRACHEYIDANAALAADETLSWMVDQITDGAFNYLGEDFPYGEWGYAPPPIFLHDFLPTKNSVTTLRKYIKENIAELENNRELTDYEISLLYSRYVTRDNQVFNVVAPGSTPTSREYQTYVVKAREFNEEDLETLRNAIIASYTHLDSWITKLLEARTALTFDPQILDMISDMNIDDLDDIDRIYKQLEDLNEYINYKIRTSFAKEDFEAYSNLRKILMTTDLVDQTFTKRNGTIASTYADLLADINPTLYQRLIDDEIDSETEETYVIQTLMRLCDSLELLESINTDKMKKIVDYLFKILAFLKSAKVDLKDFQIIFTVYDRGMNFIKFVTKLWSQDVFNYPTRDEYFRLIDILWEIFILQEIRSSFTLSDHNLGIDILHQLDDHIHLLVDELNGFHIEHITKDQFEFMVDLIHETIVDETGTKTHLNMVDKLIEVSRTEYED